MAKTRPHPGIPSPDGRAGPRWALADGDDNKIIIELVKAPKRKD